MSNRGELIIFANDSGRYFGERITNRLGIYLGDSKDVAFANTEVISYSNSHVAEKDVYIVQCVQDWTSERSVNDNFMYTASLAGATSKAGASHVTVVFPYLPYERQDFRYKPETSEDEHQREPIAAADSIRMLETVGVDGLITISAHSRQIEGFPLNPKFRFVDLSYRPIICNYIFENHRHIIDDSTSIGSPDPGGSSRAKAYARIFGDLRGDEPLPVVIGDKERQHTGEVNVVKNTELIGTVSKKILIVDDMVDTAGSLEKFVEKCRNYGAEEVYVACTHAILGGKAKERLNALYNNGSGILKKVFASDSVYHGDNFAEDNPWFEEVSVAPMFADSIRTNNEGGSISEMMKKWLEC